MWTAELSVSSVDNTETHFFVDRKYNEYNFDEKLRQVVTMMEMFEI